MLKRKLFVVLLPEHDSGSTWLIRILQSYRLEEFAQTAELYKDLSTSQAAFETEVNDLRINSGATDAQLEWKNQGHLVQKKKPGKEDMEAFETAYNAACSSIARREFGQGEVLLKRARGK